MKKSIKTKRQRQSEKKSIASVQAWMAAENSGYHTPRRLSSDTLLRQCIAKMISEDDYGGASCDTDPTTGILIKQVTAEVIRLVHLFVPIFAHRRCSTSPTKSRKLVEPPGFLTGRREEVVSGHVKTECRILQEMPNPPGR